MNSNDTSIKLQDLRQARGEHDRRLGPGRAPRPRLQAPPGRRRRGAAEVAQPDGGQRAPVGLGRLLVRRLQRGGVRAGKRHSGLLGVCGNVPGKTGEQELPFE